MYLHSYLAALDCGQITTGVGPLSGSLVLNDQYKKDVIIVTIIIIIKTCHTNQMQVIIPSSNALSLV